MVKNSNNGQRRGILSLVSAATSWTFAAKLYEIGLLSGFRNNILVRTKPKII
jgi:hypothetical protein